jgi:glycosyltransferase involved in cell wall biosynthesis
MNENMTACDHSCVKHIQLVSVIIPVFNAELYLSECLDSVLAQTWDNLEIICIDDGSQDTSPQLLNIYAEKDARIRVIHCENSGVSNARNLGTANSCGEYFTFIDADDTVSPEYVETLMGLCERYDVPLAACNHSIAHGTHISARFDPTYPEKLLNAKDACYNVLYHGIPDVSSWGKLYSRKVFDGMRYPPGMLYEDTYLIADVLFKAKQLAYTPKPLYRYRILETSISRSNYSLKKLDFITSVEYMSSRILQVYPEFEKGVQRRRCHARLSIRRYFVRCPDGLKPQRAVCEQYIRAHARQVLCDRRAPLRDKIAVCAVCISPWCYDMLWRAFNK